MVELEDSWGTVIGHHRFIYVEDLKIERQLGDSKGQFRNIQCTDIRQLGDSQETIRGQLEDRENDVCRGQKRNRFSVVLLKQ